MKTPFTVADTELAKLKRYVSAEFHNTANTLSFDEVNVAGAKETASDLYSRLKTYNNQMFRRIAKKVYHEAFVEAGGEDEPENPDAAIILAILLMYHPVTKYMYNNEVRRKQERFVEGILSSTDKEMGRAAINRAAKLWYEQGREYADISVNEARKQAFKDANVQKVKYHAQIDARTCQDCIDNDGQIYLINEAPKLPRHYHCRCWYTPVK